MEIIIPGWAATLAGVFIPALIGWLVYLTLAVFRQDRDIKLSEANDQRIMSDISKLDFKLDETRKGFEHKLDETKDDIHHAMEKLSDKFDKYMSLNVEFMQKSLIAQKQGS